MVDPMDYSDRTYYDLAHSNSELADLVLISLYNDFLEYGYHRTLDTNKIWDLIKAESRGIPRASGYVRLRGLLQGLSGMGVITLVSKGNKAKAHEFRMARTQWDRNKPEMPLHTPPVSGLPYTSNRPADKGVETVPAAMYHDAVAKNQELLKKVPELEAAIRTCMDGVKAKEQENASLKDQLATASQRSRVIKVERYDGSKMTLKNVVLPRYFDHMLALMTCRKNVLLVGPAGAGKTYAAEQAAKVLSLNFEAVSCTAGMSESHLTGRIRPKLTGDDLFQTTGFLECYEGGGVFLLDELDAADPNLMLVINTALANGYCNVPNRDENRKAKRHPDFVCVATANTYGRGATRMYSGRNQLDEATLDRFRIGQIEVDYDRVVEETLCPDAELRTWCWSVREAIEKAQLRRIMSTRFMIDAYDMRQSAAWTMKTVADVFFLGWGHDERNKCEVKRFEAVQPVKQFGLPTN